MQSDWKRSQQLSVHSQLRVYCWCKLFFYQNQIILGTSLSGGVCCPRPQYVCKLPREQGNCGTYSNRWWFNAKTGNCEEFIYSGCQGNANNFETYKECQDYCRDARSEPQCIQGTALTDSNGNFIICGGSSAASTTCPANHYCYYDGTTYGCCPTQGML